MPKPKRWQDDDAFVEWMDENGYGEFIETKHTRAFKPYLTDGVVIYMREAFCAGRDAG